MRTVPLSGLCQRVTPELACLGELGRPLLEVVTLLERLAGMSSTALSEPTFALDVLAAPALRFPMSVMLSVHDDADVA